MITVYKYKGKFGSPDLPADYIPCLVGTDDTGDEGYFETVGEIDPQHIKDTAPSRWFSHPVRVIMIRYHSDHLPDGRLVDGMRLGYVMADELLTAGVNF